MKRVRPVAWGAAGTKVALLGVGNVGGAFLQRWISLRADDRGLSLVHVANSRQAFSPEAATAGVLRAVACCGSPPTALSQVADALGAAPVRIVVDATASEAVAAHHAAWLRDGIHVVTACKLGQGTSLARWREIRAACDATGARYGDSATVGAGLPLLRTLRALRAGGDAIHAISGVLSGSLAWLFHHFDGLRPFSRFVREAREAGYTEPDPREDLSGEDVRRKLLILARAGGFELDAHEVEVEGLVPEALARLPRKQVDDALDVLDGPLRTRFAEAYRNGERLRFVARLEAGRARVGLESLAPAHPLAGGSGTDNRVALWCDRYAGQPLVIQGPGAGAAVTAAALMDDVLEIAREAVVARAYASGASSSISKPSSASSSLTRCSPS